MKNLSVWLIKGRDRLEGFRQTFDGRARRERLLMLGVVLALGATLVDRVWLSPAFSQWSQARARQVNASAALQQLKSDMLGKAAEAIALEKRQRDEVVALRDRVQRGETSQPDGTLVAAADLLPVLDQLLASGGGLRLQAMHSLGREPVVPAGAAGRPGVDAVPAAAATDPAPVLYRHGVEITVEGSYVALVAYLQALETMPQHVLWGGLQLKVDQHPKVSLTLRIYTLSMDREWLKL